MATALAAVVRVLSEYNVPTVGATAALKVPVAAARKRLAQTEDRRITLDGPDALAAAVGGLVSTMTDYGKFCHMLLVGGLCEDGAHPCVLHVFYIKRSLHCIKRSLC